MNKLTDNLMLLIFSFVMVFQKSDMAEPVLAFLMGIILAFLGIYISQERYFLALCILFPFICVFVNSLICFLPIMIYHGYRFRLRGAAVCLLPIFWALSGLVTAELILWAAVCCLGFFLAVRSERIEAIEHDIIRIRDNGVELNLMLEEKNRILIEKQDYEIYLATLKERNRIAREIHDNVGHLLSRSILQIGALGTIYKEEPLHGHLTGINDTLNLAMDSIRESVHDLHDDSIDLKQAILDATKEMKENYRLKIDFDMTKAVPKTVKYCFIATVKEAMSNIIKHSDANKIEIILREHPGFYQLSIEDNGTTSSSASTGGIGLINMKERVEALRGTLHIQSESGFKIFITIKKQEVLS